MASSDYMAVYKYQGYETGQGWTLEPRNLEGDAGGTNKSILGAKPPIFPYISPKSPLKIPRFQCPPMACFIPWISRPRAQAYSTLGYLSLGPPPSVSMALYGLYMAL